MSISFRFIDGTGQAIPLKRVTLRMQEALEGKLTYPDEYDAEWLSFQLLCPALIRRPGGGKMLPRVSCIEAVDQFNTFGGSTPSHRFREALKAMVEAAVPEGGRFEAWAGGGR